MRMEKHLNAVKDFVTDTAYDFTLVWRLRPNVLIWCVIFGALLFWM